MQNRSLLGECLQRHAISLEPDQVEMLDRYARALWAWNARLNLTRHTDAETFVARDVVDSLAFARWLANGARVLDIGTGGGVPGVILSILRPDLQLTLCESVGKKARALEAIVREVGRPLATVHARAEIILRRKTFEFMVARAVAPLPKMLGWLRPAWRRTGDLLVIKGRAWQSECDQARAEGLLKGIEVQTIATYQTPTTGAENVVLRISRATRVRHTSK
ncbi:MAG: 16S rRNA (guanine(527)-N(7))-methyltransferase RsmG [Pirellulales bacterium]